MPSRVMSPKDLIMVSIKNGSAKNMNVNGSVTPVNYDWINPTGERVAIHSVLAWVISSGIKWGLFGGIAALSNGVEVQLIDGDENVIIDFTYDGAIQTNEDWIVLSGSNTLMSVEASDDMFLIHWHTHSVTGHIPVILGPGCGFRYVINDDLTALTKFQCHLQGIRADAL